MRKKVEKVGAKAQEWESLWEAYIVALRAHDADSDTLTRRVLTRSRAALREFDRAQGFKPIEGAY